MATGRRGRGWGFPRVSFGECSAEQSKLHPTEHGSEPFFAGFAKFDIASPLGLENLRSGDATGWVGIENGVDDIPATSLYFPFVNPSRSFFFVGEESNLPCAETR